MHHAIRAERLLLAVHIACVALPTPRQISVSCGQCLLFKERDQAELLAVLEKEKVLWSRLYARSRDGYVYEQLDKLY